MLLMLQILVGGLNGLGRFLLLLRLAEAAKGLPRGVGDGSEYLLAPLILKL
jgi:hypothetical protein